MPTSANTNQKTNEEIETLGEQLYKLLAWPKKPPKIFIPPYQTTKEILERTTEDDHEENEHRA